MADLSAQYAALERRISQVKAEHRQRALLRTCVDGAVPEERAAQISSSFDSVFERHKRRRAAEASGVWGVEEVIGGGITEPISSHEDDFHRIGAAFSKKNYGTTGAENRRSTAGADRRKSAPPGGGRASVSSVPGLGAPPPSASTETPSSPGGGLGGGAGGATPTEFVRVIPLNPMEDSPDVDQKQFTFGGKNFGGGKSREGELGADTSKKLGPAPAPQEDAANDPVLVQSWPSRSHGPAPLWRTTSRAGAGGPEPASRGGPRLSSKLIPEERLALYANLSAGSRNENVVKLAEEILASREADRRTEVGHLVQF